MTDPLPTGACFFRLLDSGHTCGCQRFRPRRKPQSDATEDNDDLEECRCQHDACFHKNETPTTPARVAYRPGRSQPQQQSGPADTFEHRRARRENVNISMVTNHEEATLRRSMATMSATSGTTTERDPSASVTPSSGLLPAFQLRKPPLFAAPATSNAASRGSSLQLVRHQSRELSAAPPSDPLASSKTSDVKLQVSRLTEFAQSIKSHQMSQQDRLDLVEGLPSIIEELADKVELLDNDFATIETRHVDFEEKIENRHLDFEEKIRNEMNDRISALESFIRSQTDRKRRHRRDSEFEASSSIRGDRKRRRTREGSEVHNSFVRTTTTSFTTTTSTSTGLTQTSPPADRTFQKRIQFEVEQLTRRLTDVEKSAGPSIMRPWEIEIVMIPPSPLIAGAWLDGSSSAASTQFESSELRPSGPLAITASKASINASSTGSPVPRSFAPTSKQYLRLQSRGFIRRLHITGPTAKDVSLVIESEFGHLIDWCASFSASSQKMKSQSMSSSSSQRTARAFGSSTNPPAWQPLRKIYKQTVLEYISETELATPALWTVEYLKGNCMQRSANRTVVYIMPTQMAPRITWGDIQSLPPYVDESSPSLQDHPQPRKPLPSSLQEEKIWKFDRHLDGKSHASILESQRNSGDGAGESFCSLPFADFSKLEPNSLAEPHSSNASILSGNLTPTNSRNVVQSLQVYSIQNAGSQQPSQATPTDSNPLLQPRHAPNLNLRQHYQQQEKHLRNKSGSTVSTIENPRLTLHPASPAVHPSKQSKSTSSSGSEHERRRPSPADPPPPSPPASEPSRQLLRPTSDNTNRSRDRSSRSRSRSRHRSRVREGRRQQRQRDPSPPGAHSPPPTYVSSAAHSNKSFENSGTGKRRDSHTKHDTSHYQQHGQGKIQVKQEDPDDEPYRDGSIAIGSNFESIFGTYDDDNGEDSTQQSDSASESQDEGDDDDGDDDDMDAAATDPEDDDSEEDDDDDDDDDDGSDIEDGNNDTANQHDTISSNTNDNDTEPETSFSEIQQHTGEGQIRSQVFPPSAASGSGYHTLQQLSQAETDRDTDGDGDAVKVKQEPGEEQEQEQGLETGKPTVAAAAATAAGPSIVADSGNGEHVSE